MLSELKFEKAKNYIFTRGRKLERALYSMHFGSGTAEEVIDALIFFQNEDGGFGKGLESDLRSENSSVIATSHALAICREIGLKNHHVVEKALKYVLDHYDEEKKVFPSITEAVLDQPHPWWWKAEDLEKNFDGFRINPTVEILAHLLHYQSLVPDKKELIASLHDEVVSRIKSMESIGVYELRGIRSLFKADNFDENLRSELVEKLTPVVKDNIAPLTKGWDGYGMNPLNIVCSPSDFFIGAVDEKMLKDNLQYDLSAQEGEGAWPLNWSWMSVDRDLWFEAEKEWKAVIALQKLKIYKAFENYSFS